MHGVDEKVIEEHHDETHSETKVHIKPEWVELLTEARIETLTETFEMMDLKATGACLL